MLWLSREGERAAKGTDRFTLGDVPAVTEISCRARLPTCYLLRHATDPCRRGRCLHRFFPRWGYNSSLRRRADPAYQHRRAGSGRFVAVQCAEPRPAGGIA